MTPLLEQILRAGRAVAAALAWLQERIFTSKYEQARRITGRSEMLKRAEFEADRIDRLRNPGNYQGR
jgi:hypothetical protein